MQCLSSGSFRGVARRELLLPEAGPHSSVCRCHNPSSTDGSISHLGNCEQGHDGLGSVDFFDILVSVSLDTYPDVEFRHLRVDLRFGGASLLFAMMAD